MARGARLTYPPENGFLCPLLLVYNFCVILATLLSPDVLNRGHPGLFNNISFGWVAFFRSNEAGNYKKS